MNIKIVSGGQTGVDQGALEVAARLGLEFGGWTPHGWLAPDLSTMAEIAAQERGDFCYTTCVRLKG